LLSPPEATTATLFQPQGIVKDVSLYQSVIFGEL
jgi:hypothetical protein